MGCDIHSIGQVKKSGTWETVVTQPGGDDRDYNSFAVLAGVRNGYGFGGCKTGEGWPVLYEQRGLPEDIQLIDGENVKLTEPFYWSETSDPEYEFWIGDHSHSWLTLKELHNIYNIFNGKTYKKSGMVSEEQYNIFLKEGKPKEWCGWTNQENYKKIEWLENAQDLLGTLRSMMEVLNETRLKYNVSEDDIRVVFGFDN